MLRGSNHYLTPSKKHWIVDIETDDLNATRIWVVCVKNALTKEKRTLIGDDAIRSFFEEFKDCFFVGHNILKFDGPTINRLCGLRIPVGRLVDTLVLSMLYSPNLAGGHSLETWGQRLGIRKSSFNDFSRLTDEMIKYCEQDVEVCLALFLRLTERMRKIGFTDLGAEIEHRSWFIAHKQQQAGFYFSQRDGHILLAELTGVLANLTGRIRRMFPSELKLFRTYAKAYTVSGEPTANFVKHEQQFERLDVHPDGTYDAYHRVEFNIGSPQQRVEKLLELGWVPGETERTKAGNPTPTKKGELVPSLAAFAESSGVEEIKLIAQWIAINGRINSLNDWLDKFNPDTHCIHGSLWLAGSLRFRHDKPNTANIPAVPVKEEKVNGEKVVTVLRGMEGLYKYEARDLWRTRDPLRRNLVGVDAAGIQLRVLAHYLNDREYIDTILHGDIHSTNQRITGIRTRDQTKTFTYAVLLGAGAARVREITGESLKESAAIKRRFIEGVPGLRRLYDRLEEEFDKSGRITLCDGSLVLVPSKHMVLAYLLQGDESRLMKVASIIVDEQVRKQKLDAIKVGDIHDEWQNDVLIEHTEPFIEVCTNAFRSAGEFFNYNIRIDSTPKIGKTWAETH